MRRRRPIVIAVAVIALMWTLLGARATHTLDTDADDFAGRAEDAFAGTDRSQIQKLDDDLDAGVPGAEQRLVSFLARPGRIPVQFGADGDDYLARYEVEAWNADRTVDVRWTVDDTTVSLGP